VWMSADGGSGWSLACASAPWCALDNSRSFKNDARCGVDVDLRVGRAVGWACLLRSERGR
jgi:hypothetical protein